MASSSSSSMYFSFFSSPPHCHLRNHSRSNLFVGIQKPSLLLGGGGGLPLSRPSLILARRRNNASATTSSKKKDPKKKEKDLAAWEADLKRREKKLLQHDDEEGDDLDEDAIEALFSQLEEDLKNDNLSTDDSDDEITEEDLARLEQELADALGDEDDDESSAFLSNTDNVESDDDTDDEEERPVKLRNWQLRRLASALKIGRRKTSIKSLSAELGLDRAVVLELLRDPPPNLLLMCAALPDKVVPTPLETESDIVDSSPATMVDVVKSEPEEKLPVPVMHSRWSTQKRLKKVQAETLERVYSRSKRPTNTMIASIVHVTNLPRKTVVKWFEDRRLEDGVPDKRSPFRPVVREIVSTN